MAPFVQFDILHDFVQGNDEQEGRGAMLTRYVIGYKGVSDGGTEEAIMIPWPTIIEHRFLEDIDIITASSATVVRSGGGEFYLTWSDRRTLFIHLSTLSSSDSGTAVSKAQAVPISPPTGQMDGAQTWCCSASGRVCILSSGDDHIYVMDFLQPLEERIIS
jgi:hypothetical protein